MFWGNSADYIRFIQFDSQNKIKKSRYQTQKCLIIRHGEHNPGGYPGLGLKLIHYGGPSLRYKITHVILDIKVNVDKEWEIIIHYKVLKLSPPALSLPGDSQWGEGNTPYDIRPSWLAGDWRLSCWPWRSKPPWYELPMERARGRGLQVTCRIWAPVSYTHKELNSTNN